MYRIRKFLLALAYLSGFFCEMQNESDNVLIYIMA